MSFAPVPNYTKNQIKQAGKILVDQPAYTSKQVEGATIIAGEWRACHAYPLNTFNTTLRDKVRNGYDNPIVAQRLKRLPTVIDKLKRYENMQLTTMQDIGGVRAVLKNPKEVNKLVDQYLNGRFEHELVNHHDYIKSPRDEDGYRSVHLVYKYKNRLSPGKEYNGLRLELQIRTRQQHTWATAVETMGTLLGQALKSRQGEQEWLDFFAVTSSAFAYKERTSLIPKYAHLSRKETFGQVAKAVKELDVLEKMQAYSFAMTRIGAHVDRKKWSYHLLTLDTLERTIQIKSYGRGELQQASADYAAAEALTKTNPKIDSVLVSAGPIEDIRRAYPNYFLDVGGFIENVRRIIKEYEQET